MRRFLTHSTLPALIASALLLPDAPGAFAAASPRAPAAGKVARPAAPVSVPLHGSSVGPWPGQVPAGTAAPVARSAPVGPPTDTSSVAPAAGADTHAVGGTGNAVGDTADGEAAREGEEGEEAPNRVSEMESDSPAPGEPPLVNDEPLVTDAPPATDEPLATDEPPTTEEMRAADVPPPADEPAAGHEPLPEAHEPAAEPADDVQVARAEFPRPVELGIAIDPLEGPSGPSPEVPLAAAVAQAEERRAKPLHLLHGEVPPGTAQRLSWSATELFEGVPIATPVLVVNGRLAGPTLCLTAAVHGDELNGIEMVRRVMHNLNPKELSGAVVGVPIVNLQGFRSGSRYLPDRRDLNRYFPGNPQGSQASRIAFSFFTEIVTHCDALIDLHTGSFERANLPQLRADLRNPDVVTLTQGFGATVVLHSEPAEGTLRWAATRAGIPAVTLEAGGPTELEIQEVMHGVKGIETLLHTLGMVRDNRFWGDPEPVYYQSTWVRANSGGILLSAVSLGSTVQRGDLLGTITDPMSNDRTNLYSPYAGRVIGMARNQVVMPGFAAFHVGIQAVEASPVERDVRAAPKDAAPTHEAEPSEQDYVNDGMSE